MFICVTHVDATTRVPCTDAPMATGPDFPSVKGLQIVWANESAWPTDKPLFYGTCDDDADINIPGVVAVYSEQQYLSIRNAETTNQAIRVRNHRDYLLRSHIDTLNPIRWGDLTTEEQLAWREYRQALLDVPQQDGFPWVISWPLLP